MMIFAGVIIIVSLMGIVLFALTKRLTAYTPSRPVTLVAGIIGILGLILTWYAAGLLGQSLDRKNWPTATAKILSSEVIGEKRAFRPQIMYQFHVDSILYQNQTDLHISGFGNKRSRRDNARRIAGEYAGLKQLLIYYNPVNPNESYVRTGPFWSDYMKLMLGATLCIASFYLLLLNSIRRKTDLNT
jgi:hypothetical protein